MDIQYRDQVAALWNDFFPGVSLPLVLFYTNEKTPEPEKADLSGEHCMIAELRQAQEGKTVIFNKTSIRCMGGRRYSGFSNTLRSNFRYFLSHGDDKIEGERYKKTPELVDEIMEYVAPFEAQAANLICKRWDKIHAGETPELVLFLATPDVLAGLFTLANYDRADMNGVICPFGSGCSSIIYHPLKEMELESPRAVLGMFDVSARPCVHPGTLSFTVPYKRFVEMAANIPESFLITESWTKVKSRMLEPDEE